MSQTACLAFTSLDDPGAEEVVRDGSFLRARLDDSEGGLLLLAALDDRRLEEAILEVEGVRVHGVDGSALAWDDETDSPSCFVDLVLDPADPPIPFDDPTTIGIFHDYQRWYLPMLGVRVVRCETLWDDGVRAAGGLLAFEAASREEAEYFGASNPWRRVAAGRLLRAPAGVFARGKPPPGPGTQRMDVFVCGDPVSQAEPGTAAL